MNLDDKSIKQLRRLILFTIVILIAPLELRDHFRLDQIRVRDHIPVPAGRRDRVRAECADDISGREAFP